MFVLQTISVFHDLCSRIQKCTMKERVHLTLSSILHKINLSLLFLSLLSLFIVIVELIIMIIITIYCHYLYYTFFYKNLAYKKPSTRQPKI